MNRHTTGCENAIPNRVRDDVWDGRRGVLWAIVLLSASVVSANAQFAEPSTVVAVAGIHGQNGSMRVDATLGQPFAMRLEGAGYVAEIGFWTHRPMTSTPIEDVEADALPERFELDQNYPNPFNPATVIRYALPDAGYVRLTVYDSRGRRAAELVNTTQPTGYHEVRFDATNLPSGVYLYRLEGPGASETRAMLLTR